MSFTVPLPPRTQLCNRSCSNKHTHKQWRVQQRCPRPDQLSPASSAHRGCRESPSPLLRASALHRLRHGMGHLQQDSQTRHRHVVPVRAQHSTPAPVPRARARTTLQGELAIPVPRYRHPRATIAAGKGWGICRFTHTSQACRVSPLVPRPPAHNTARPHLQLCARAERSADPRKLLAPPPQSQPRGLGRRLRLLVPSCEVSLGPLTKLAVINTHA